MNLLVVKTSSLGDIIHTFPAVTDLKRALPDSRIDWVVEEDFADLPRLHPAVDQVIPIAIRRWRLGWYQARAEIMAFRNKLQARQYDLVIDAQGLIKSAIVSWLATGPVAGQDRQSAREPLAALFYQKRIKVPRSMHAVERTRRLFAEALGYEPGELAYGLVRPQPVAGMPPKIMFIHGTTWVTKLWPEHYWTELGKLCEQAGFEVCLPEGNDEERARAGRIVQSLNRASILPRGGLASLLAAIAGCRGAVSVDTGPGHLATALNVPLIGLYGATDPALTGFHGPNQRVIASDHLPCAPCLDKQCRYDETQNISKVYPPCYEPLTPARVFDQLQEMIDSAIGTQP